MNILIVLKRNQKEEDFYKKHEILLKHAENWVGKDNDVYVMTNIKKQSRQSSTLSFVNPPKYLFNNLLVSAWFSMVNHPRFDFVIEEVSFTPFVYRKSEKIFYIPSLSTKSKKVFRLYIWKKILSLFIKLFYNRSYFLSSSWETSDFLKGLGIKDKKIHLFKKGLEFGKKKRAKVRPGKHLLVLLGKDPKRIDTALQILRVIERRDLEWKFTLLVSPELEKKAKEVFSSSGLISPIRVVVEKSIINSLNIIEKVNILLDLVAGEESVSSDIVALKLQVPVVAIESDFLKNIKEIEKYFFVSPGEDYFTLAQNVLDYVKDEKKYQKKVDSSEDLVRSYTWRNLADNSLNFLENMRL